MRQYNSLRTRKIQFNPNNLFAFSLGTAFFISQPVTKVSANPVTVTVNSTSYSLTTQVLRSYDLDLNLMQSQDWFGDTSLAELLAGQLSNQLSLTEPNASWLGAFLVTGNFLFEDEFLGESEQQFNYTAGSTNGVVTGTGSWFQARWGYNFVISSVSDDGDATYSITGTANATTGQSYAGKTLTVGVSADDPDGNGSVTSYNWQSSSDGTNWSNINGATSSTFTVTSSEEGKYIRVSVVYTDGEGTSESVTASPIEISQLQTEWLQPYAAMQTIGLGSIKDNRDLVFAKAGECNNYGWVIKDTEYCLYTNANNTISSVKENSSYGGYDYAKFNTSLNIEKTMNDKLILGVAYGVGSSNLYNYNLYQNYTSTTASLSSTSSHYSIYGVKKVNDKFTLKGIIGSSDFENKGKRKIVSGVTESITSTYDTYGYTAEINGTWDIKKTIKNMKNPIRLQPSIGVAYAAHIQDEFSESGSGNLITVESNQAESLLFKTGIIVDKQISMESGKWLLVPSLAFNYEMDTYADDNYRELKGGLTESSTAHTKVSSKVLGQHNASIKLGADFLLTKNFIFNLNAKYGLVEGGDEQAYGGGFIWHF